MGQVISLHAERWVEGVFERKGVRVDVSTKGNVRFYVYDPDGSTFSAAQTVVLSMEDMAAMTEALSVAYREDDGG